MKFICSGRARLTCVFILLAVLSGLSPHLLSLPRSSSPDGTNQVDLQIIVLEGDDDVVECRTTWIPTPRPTPPTPSNWALRLAY